MMYRVSCTALWLKVFRQRREAFTKNSISQALSQYPKFNWVICHSPYSVAFDGVEGTDWGYTHHELRISLNRKIGSVFLVMYLQYFVSFFSYSLLNRYDLYWARSGKFYRYGDGGFINVRIQRYTIFQTCNSTMIFIQYSGRMVATYSGPMMVERQFNSVQYPNLTSRVLSLELSSLEHSSLF